MDRVALISSTACGLMRVAYAQNSGVCMPCGARAMPRTIQEGVVGSCESYVFLEGVSTNVLPPVLPGVCVVIGGGLAQDDGLPQGGVGCTVMGADDACWGTWMGLAAVAAMWSPPAGVMVVSPWTVRRRRWRSAGSVQVLVGSVIQWRRMAWSPGVISSSRSVPLWTTHSCGRFRNPLWSGVVPCFEQSSILVM